MLRYSLKKIFANAIAFRSEDRFLFPSPLPRSLDDWLTRPISADKNRIKNMVGVFMAERVDSMFATLMKSPAFRGMYEANPDIGIVPVFFTPLKNASGAFSWAEDIICIHYEPVNKRAFIWAEEPKFISTLAHEYRHAWQKIYGSNKVTDFDFSRLMQSYMREADANAFQATVLWEVKEAGVAAPWSYYKETQGACAQALISAIKENPASLHDGTAQNAVFLAWFSDAKNVTFYADEYIENIKAILQKPLHEVAKGIIDMGMNEEKNPKTAGRGILQKHLEFSAAAQDPVEFLSVSTKDPFSDAVHNEIWGHYLAPGFVPDQDAESYLAMLRSDIREGVLEMDREYNAYMDHAFVMAQKIRRENSEAPDFYM